jgi:hypothetical protein
MTTHVHAPDGDCDCHYTLEAQTERFVQRTASLIRQWRETGHPDLTAFEALEAEANSLRRRMGVS